MGRIFPFNLRKRKRNNQNFLFLALILILALAVRSAFFGTYFTGDAIDTVGPARNFAETGRAAAYGTSDTQILPIAHVEDGLYFNFSHPPMKTLLYSLWAAAFGFNAFMIFLPIIFGLLSIVFIYLIGRQLYSAKVGLVAAVLGALLRYHFYASTMAFGDNFLMLTFAASIYFFIRFLDTNRRIYLAPFFVLTISGFLTKLSSVAIIPVLLVVAFIMRGKVKFPISFALIAAAAIISIAAVWASFPLTEALTGVSNSDFNFFDSYIRTFLLARIGYQDIAYEKAFYVSSFAWQLTPFFAALLLLSLVKLKRDKTFLILFSWLAITFLIGFASSGQDFQRLMVIAVAPAIILCAKFVDGLGWKKDLTHVIFAAAAIFALAFLTGLNDMLPHYSLPMVAFFFLLGAVFIFLPKNRQLLLGASVGLSVFFLFGTAFFVQINSSAAGQLIHAVQDSGYPYNQLWTDRDISLYLALDGEPSFLQRPKLSEEFLKANNVRYLAFYSIYEENRIVEISKLCEDKPFFAEVNGRKVGLACALASAPK